MTGFKVILSDKVSYSTFKQNRFHMTGDRIDIREKLSKPVKKNSSLRNLMKNVFTVIHKYRVKILENINLEGDESFLCKDYSYPGEYDQCLQAEYIREGKGGGIKKNTENVTLKKSLLHTVP